MSVEPDIPAFLDRRPFVGTFTMLSSYKNCPHQMYRRYIKKDQPYVETPEMKWGNDVHSAFEYRVGYGKPLPENMMQWEVFAKPFDGHKVAVEQKLGISSQGRQTGFWDKDVWFRGKADAAIISSETAYLADWKTGKSAYEDPFELETNAVLLHAKFPHLKKIVGSYVWLKENRVSQIYDLSDTRQTWGAICKLMAEILAKRDTGDFEAVRSGLCGWCSVSDCEHWRPRK